MDFIEEFIDFLIGASEQTRQHVDSVIKEAIACSVKVFLWALQKLNFFNSLLIYITFKSKHKVRMILN